MGAFQSLIAEERQKPADASPPASAGRPEPQPRKWFSFRRQRELVGIDIGSSLIKVVVLRSRHGRITLQHAAITPTPAGAVTEGELTDGLTISRTLRTLCKDYGIRNRHVAVAVGGEKVFGQLESVPIEERGQLRAFVERRAEPVISYPLESSALDYQQFDSLPGRDSPSVLWVSSAAEQVDWFREVVTLAGKVPVVVDVQACALVNAFLHSHQPAPDDAVVLLHVGVRHMTVALLCGPALVYARDTVIARDWHSGQQGSLPERVMQELDRHWDTLCDYAEPASPHWVCLSGGPARTRELGEELQTRLGMRVQEIDPFRNITYSPASEPGRVVREHGPALSVAVGLALRSFDDL